MIKLFKVKEHMQMVNNNGFNVNVIITKYKGWNWFLNNHPFSTAFESFIQIQ